MEALNLCLRVLTQPGDAVLIEAPTYMGHLQTLENLNLRAVPVPICPTDGIDPEHFEDTLQRHNIKTALLTPTFNNPTGALVSRENKQRLLDIAYRYNVPIIEDDVYGDLVHGNDRPAPLKSMDQHGNVLYCSSFSKTLSAGVRIGWVVSEFYKEKISNLQFMSTVSVAAPSQHAVSNYLKGGHYQRHLKALRRSVCSSIARAKDTIAKHFPKGTRVTCPQGGFLLWLELPENVDSLELYREAVSQNISFAPGPLFGATESCYKNFIRLNVAMPSDGKMEELLAQLGKLARRVAIQSVS
jgi:DNA-binding transcriptional MocR family regulator